MARGGKRGNPYRDANGRFASASTGRAVLGASRAKSSPAAARKAAKSQSGRASTLAARSSLRRSRAKLAGRDPADQRLSSALSNRAQKGAVARGNKALSAAKAAAQTKLQGASAAGTISKNRPKPATATTAARPITPPAARVPAAQRPGSMANILGSTLRALAQVDAQRIREIESITGQKVRAPKQPTKSVATVRKSGPRSVSGTLGDNLKQLAQSDARFMRGMAEIARDATPKVAGRKAKGGGKAVGAAGRAARSIGPAKTATSVLATKNKKKLAKGPRAFFSRVATPTGAIRKSDFAKIKADAQKGIGTPFSRASQRAVARSAREAPLIRQRAIADAKRKGKTGFERGPKMNTGAIANNRDFGWNRKGEPATTQERLDMWRKSERRIRGFWSGSRGVAGAYAGDLRASRRAAQLVESGNRLGNLPTTRKLAEQPRERRLSRLEANRTKANLEWSNADRTIKPKIDKLQAKIKERQAAGKKATEAQVNNLRELVNQYNKSVRRRQVTDAAQSFYQSPWTYKPKKFSGKNIDRQLTDFL